MQYKIATKKGFIVFIQSFPFIVQTMRNDTLNSPTDGHITESDRGNSTNHYSEPVAYNRQQIQYRQPPQKKCGCSGSTPMSDNEYTAQQYSPAYRSAAVPGIDPAFMQIRELSKQPQFRPNSSPINTYQTMNDR